MSELTFKFDENGLSISLGWIWIIVLAAIIVGAIVLCIIRKRKKATPNLKLSSITTNLGFGNATFEVDHSLRQTAYAIYIELTTRKIALPYEEEKDVIVEVYDSWYKAFGIIRDCLRETKVESLDEEFVIEIKAILNDGLRLHLTNWQAKFRRWYKSSLDSEEFKNKTPQELQKEYPEYGELLEDLLKTNKVLIQLANGLHDIVFGVNK